MVGGTWPTARIPGTSASVVRSSWRMDSPLVRGGLSRSRSMMEPTLLVVAEPPRLPSDDDIASTSG